LIKLINHLIENGFADESLSGLFKLVTSPEEAIGALKVKD
jgi:hypothetical protein